MSNASTVVGSLIDTAVSPDPDMCRVSGYLRNAHNQALAGQSFVLRYCYIPMGIATTTLILQERLTIKADAAGYVEFDLLRGAKLSIELPNLLPWVYQEITVPDSASADLIDIIFPYLVSVEFAEPNPESVSVGGLLAIYVNGTLSNGETIEKINSAALTIDIGDSGIFAKSEGNVYVGVSVGTTTLTISAVDVTKVDEITDRDGNDIILFDRPAVTLPGASKTVNVTP